MVLDLVPGRGAGSVSSGTRGIIVIGREVKRNGTEQNETDDRDSQQQFRNWMRIETTTMKGK